MTQTLGGKAEGWRTLYSWRASVVWERLALDIHESSSAEYPFHQIKKEQFHGFLWWCKIHAILYSFSPVISSGSGFEKFGPCTVFSR